MPPAFANYWRTRSRCSEGFLRQESIPRPKATGDPEGFYVLYKYFFRLDHFDGEANFLPISETVQAIDKLSSELNLQGN